MSSEHPVPPVDADGDLGVPEQRRELRERPAVVLVAIACGGALGALARNGLNSLFPHEPGGMPWATLGVNASGCLLMGVLMVLISDVWPGQRLLRPFLGVGVLGGYTTFSTCVVDVQQAVAAGKPQVALIYLGSTVLVAMLAVFAGSVLMTALLKARGRRS